jgi:tRNA G26 N,N-dimethylase Trm1
VATVPVATTWASSEFVTSAIANARIKDAVAFFLNPPMAVLRHSAVQSIATSTFTALLFDTEDKDTDGGHSTVTNTSRYTAQTAGMYLVSGQYSSAINATGQRAIRLAKNGVVVPSAEQIIPPMAPSSIEVIGLRSQLVALGVGDFLELHGFQASGGALNTSTTSEAQCGMTVLWVGTG